MICIHFRAGSQQNFCPHDTCMSTGLHVHNTHPEIFVHTYPRPHVHTCMSTWSTHQQIVHTSTCPHIHKSTRPQVHRFTLPHVYTLKGSPVHSSAHPDIHMPDYTSTGSRHTSTGPHIHIFTGPHIHMSICPLMHSSTAPQLHTSTGPHGVGVWPRTSAPPLYLPLLSYYQL